MELDRYDGSSGRHERSVFVPSRHGGSSDWERGSQQSFLGSEYSGEDDWDEGQNYRSESMRYDGDKLGEQRMNARARQEQRGNRAHGTKRRQSSKVDRADGGKKARGATDEMRDEQQSTQRTVVLYKSKLEAEAAELQYELDYVNSQRKKAESKAKTHSLQLAEVCEQLENAKATHTSTMLELRSDLNSITGYWLDSSSENTRLRREAEERDAELAALSQKVASMESAAWRRSDGSGKKDTCLDCEHRRDAGLAQAQKRVNDETVKIWREVSRATSFALEAPSDAQLDDASDAWNGVVKMPGFQDRASADGSLPRGNMADMADRHKQRFEDDLRRLQQKIAAWKSRAGTCKYLLDNEKVLLHAEKRSLAEAEAQFKREKVQLTAAAEAARGEVLRVRAGLKSTQDRLASQVEELNARLRNEMARAERAEKARRAALEESADRVQRAESQVQENRRAGERLEWNALSAQSEAHRRMVSAEQALKLEFDKRKAAEEEAKRERAEREKLKVGWSGSEDRMKAAEKSFMQENRKRLHAEDRLRREGAQLKAQAEEAGARAHKAEEALKTTQDMLMKSESARKRIRTQALARLKSAEEESKTKQHENLDRARDEWKHREHHLMESCSMAEARRDEAEQERKAELCKQKQSEEQMESQKRQWTSCMEKTESRVKTLEENCELERKKREEVEEMAFCTICLERPRSVVIQPCLHFQICGPCVARFKPEDKCPTCRAPVEKMLQVFLP